MTTYPLPSPSHPRPKSMSVSALIAGAATATVAAGAMLAAGMAEWQPGDWAAFAGTLVFLGGAFVGGAVKLLAAIRRDHVKMRTEVRQDVQTGAATAAKVASAAAAEAVQEVKTEAAKMVPPEQLADLAKLIAAEMRQSSPPPDGMIPDGRPRVGA